MKAYFKSVDEVYSEVKSGANGLSQVEAEKRLSENGQNKLAEPPTTSNLVRFLKQLADPMIIVLLGAAAVSAGTAIYTGHGMSDVIIIMAVVIINAFLGVFQESKAEKAIDALQKMTAEKCFVIRGGSTVEINTQDLVVGDIVLLEAGDSVPADGRIMEAASLQIEESPLTGESLPEHKHVDTISGDADIPLGDRENMCYMGTTVVYGRGKAVITATGMDTEMGTIAEALTAAKEEKTPLQKKLLSLSKILTYVVIGICIFIFAFRLISTGNFETAFILDTFLIAVSLAVAAIPEGLATVVTIVLSIGVTNMSKRKAVIRKLTAVETLGSTQIICSDKTGTLTQNKMTVVDSKTTAKEFLALAMAMASDATIGAEDAQGEPTECALVNFANTLSLNKTNIEKILPRLAEAPFDSVRKRMTTVHSLSNDFSLSVNTKEKATAELSLEKIDKNTNSHIIDLLCKSTSSELILDDKTSYISFTKGAPDEVLKVCDYYLENGVAKAMTTEKRTEILAGNKEMADKALRVLGGAYKLYTNLDELNGESNSDTQSSTEHSDIDVDVNKLESGLVFIGLVGMIDPVRPEVLLAIDDCKKAGIRPIMITGDHIDTAIAIAKSLGIIVDKEELAEDKSGKNEEQSSCGSSNLA
ncbi:MAG: cation-translocating P-type ATPase, partial [Anaerovoracaceae bacterium]